MDARDIKEIPPVVEDGRYLEAIYSLQKELIDHYVGIEGLPQYPLDVNTKKNQLLIKDFVGRVIEELAEGYESFKLVGEITEKNQLWFNGDYNNEYVQMLNHLQNANEEQADALHFMVELLIFANIQPEDIDSYCNKIYDDLNQHTLTLTTNTLHKAGMIGYNMLKVDNGSEVTTPVLNLLTLLDSDKDTSLIKGGSLYSSSSYLEMKSNMWDVVYHLNIARNYLKNKPWKQSQMMTNESAFQEELVKAFIKLIGYFYTLGLNDLEDIYTLYFKKQRVNKFRIHSNY